MALTAADTEWAASEAARLLRPLEARWRHVRGVVAQADRVAPVLAASERPWLLAAAYLHDIGYAPELVATGLHAIDGALWLRAQRHERLARLVAHHTGARFEARLRGLGAAIAGFEHEQSPTDDALTYCDLTTSPSGARVSVEQRLTEIERRYGEGHAVSVAMRRARPSLLEAVRRTELRLAYTPPGTCW
jgi:hypothetical protein